MQVRLILVGPLKLPPEGRDLKFHCRKGTGVRTILRRALGYSDQEIGFLQIIRDGNSLSLNDKITEDTELYVILRLGGG